MDFKTKRLILPKPVKRTHRGKRAGIRLRAGRINGNRPKSGLTAGILNAQSIRNKVDQIHDVIIEYDIDIFTFTETWLTSKAKDEFFLKALAISGYKLFSVPRKGNKGWGGVAILYKSNLVVSSCSSTQSATSFETCEMVFSLGAKCLRVVVVYRPPPSTKNKLSIPLFFEEFTPALQSYAMSPGDLLITGDINFHLDIPSESAPRRFLELIDSFGLMQHIDFPTHRSLHTLDIAITRSDSNIVSSLTQGDMISDHNLVIVNVSYPKPSPKRVTVMTRKLRDVDLNSLRKDISEMDWPTGDTNLHSMCSAFHTGLRDILDQHAPEKAKTVTIRPSQPWFSPEVHEAKTKKRKAEKLWRKSGLTVHKEIYQQARNTFNMLIDSTKSVYFNRRIEEADGNPRERQKLYQSILQSSQEVKLPRHSNQRELADKFANFFHDKVEAIRLGLPTANKCIENNPVLVTKNHSFSVFEPVTCDELSSVVKKSPTKSCQLDPLPTWVIKATLPEIVVLMRDIVNCSLKSGDVPEQMKIALVSPLLKKPSLDPEILQNYRPVSNLSFLSKVLERVVAARVITYMDSHNLHDVFQSAYKTKHSTETALLRVQNDIRNMIDRDGAAVLVLLDLSAAFDTIDHEVLLSRLQNLIGIDGIPLKWFRSYLTERKQHVCINGTRSAPQTLNYGVPQGSVLGPILFLIYILPLSHLIDRFGTPRHGYADDNQLYVSLPVTEAASRIIDLESCLVDIQDWLTINKLKGNPSKTEIKLFGLQRVIDSLDVESLVVAGVQVSLSCGPVRNLGVYFDQTLSMESHINYIVKSATYHLRNIGRVRRRLTTSATKELVQSLVISRLDYGNSLLAGVNDQLLHKLQLVQNCAARIITRTRLRDHITPVLRSLHWLPIPYRINFKVLLMVFKAKNKLAPSYISDILPSYVPGRSLRSENHALLVIPRYRLEAFGGRSFAVYASRLWNSLDTITRNSSTVSEFKRRLKTKLYGQCFC